MWHKMVSLSSSTIDDFFFKLLSIVLSRSLSLSLTHTHTHTLTHWRSGGGGRDGGRACIIICSRSGLAPADYLPREPEKTLFRSPLELRSYNTFRSLYYALRVLYKLKPGTRSGARRRGQTAVKSKTVPAALWDQTWRSESIGNRWLLLYRFSSPLLQPSPLSLPLFTP